MPSIHATPKGAQVRLNFADKRHLEETKNIAVFVKNWAKGLAADYASDLLSAMASFLTFLPLADDQQPESPKVAGPPDAADLPY